MIDTYTFSFDNDLRGEADTGEKLEFNGEAPTSGFVRIYNDGDTDLSICNDYFCACKGKTSSKIFVLNIEEGVCAINEDGSVANNPITTTMLSELQEQIDNIGTTIYPIGSIYLSLEDTDPSELFGGIWVAYGEGRTLVGVGTGTDENSVQKTFTIDQIGGEYIHSLSIAELPSHSHTGSVTSAGSHTHTGSAGSAGSHGHNLKVHGSSPPLSSILTNGVSGREQYSSSTPNGSANSHILENGDHTHTLSLNSAGSHTHSLTIDSTGEDNAHNVMQPYVTVYMWKRVE